MTEPEVLTRVENGVGQIVLNRPRALNALNRPMLDALWEALTAWVDDDAVTAVELSGNGERAFCSGADVRAVREVVLAGGDYMDFFRREYAVDRLIAEYPKPVTAHMHGITMGGGLGISAHARHRILGPGARLAMPETLIGFSTDAGVLYELTRAPGETGLHLALTAENVGAADGLYVGLADRSAVEVGEAKLPRAREEWLDECYAGDDAAEILGRLSEHSHPDARAAAEAIGRMSPFSVAVSLEAFRRAARLGSVGEVLDQDYRMAQTVIPAPDFAEGVRAQLVDKDFSPTWSHAHVSDVTRDEVLACFDPA